MQSLTRNFGRIIDERLAAEGLPLRIGMVEDCHAPRRGRFVFDDDAGGDADVHLLLVLLVIICGVGQSYGCLPSPCVLAFWKGAAIRNWEVGGHTLKT